MITDVTAAANVAATVELDTATARRLVSQARNALALADDLLATLLAGRAWLALGHADWPALCAAELPELRHLKLRAPARRARIAALRAAAPAATVRDLVAATGAGLATVHADVAALSSIQPGPADTAERAACNRAATVADHRPAAPAHLLIAEAVAAAGARGLTIPGAVRKLGWSYGATSGALSRAEARGLVHRPAALEQRGGFRPYLAGPRP